ncbi:MAG: UvrD-helicase domain-containing protein [Erysipelothrix sp.]|nr:UvrD-helicase domain-containing protein [Erysipelothrix sp.]
MLTRNNQISSLAINTLNKNILVSASAGAGKTKLLIDRLIKRITVDKIPVNKILALTFTEAAAFEMKDRLRTEIKKILLEADDAFLQNQLSLIETASISTIHSFCLSIVKDYSYVLNLNPKLVNNLLDEAIKKSYLDLCLDQTILAAIDENHQDFVLTVETLCNRAHQFDPLKKVLTTIMNIRSGKVDPDAWDAQVLQFYDPIDTLKDLPEPLLTIVKEALDVDIQQMQHVLNQIIDRYTLILEADIEPWHELQKLLILIEKLIEHAEFDRVYSLLKTAGTIKTKTLKDEDEYKELRLVFNDLLKENVEFYIPEPLFVEDIGRQQPIVRQLLRLTDDLMVRYHNMKTDQLVMDFDDMEKYALAILTAPDFDVARVYQATFEDVLVDEFQDTSDIQHEIIKCVSRHDNVFRVGDVKQSIYQFRNAKPQLMRDLIEQKDDNMVLVLPNNFRSVDEIVRANNHLFEQLMNIDTFEDVYLDDDHVAIGLDEQKSKGFPVELDIIDYEREADQDYDETNTMVYEESNQEALIKTRHIANRIVELNKQGYKFKDMCVLVRTHSIKSHLRTVFDDVNIPYFIDTKSGFFMSQPIQDVLSFLKVLNDSHDDISFMGLMMSPFFQLNFDALASEAIANKEARLTYYEHFKQAYPLIIDQIENLKRNIKKETLAQILQRLYQVNDYYRLHCDEQAKINLDYLLEKAHAIDAQGNHSIMYFLDVVANIQDEVSSEAIAVSSDADVVKVMTIHQSKGLQFKVVFFYSNSRNHIVDLREKVIVDPELGLGMHTLLLPLRLQRSNIIRKAIEFNMIKQELQEQIRLLYVALTRARERLICVSITNKEDLREPMNQYTIYKRKGNGHWLNLLFVQSHVPFLKYQIVSPTHAIAVVDQKKHMKDDRVLEPLMKKPKAKARPVTYVPSLQLTPYVSPTEFGTLIHKILELLIDNHLSFNKAVMDLMVDENMQSQIQQWLQHPMTQPLKAMTLLSEYPCITYYEDQYQQIYIDLLAQSETQNIIVDFKSDRVADEKELVARYQAQLDRYKHTLNVLYPQHETIAYIYSLHLNQYIQV